MELAAQSSRRRWKKKHFVAAGVIAVAVTVVAILMIKLGVKEFAQALVLELRDLGPVVFFAAMALLPAVGFPLMAFTLAAGPVFGPVLGAGWVLTWSLLAVIVNLLLTYWLANHALRPVVTRLLTYFEFRLPESRADNAWQLALIVRLTPGPPYWAQSYLLGLIRVPLGPYLIVSLLVISGYISALIFGGEALAAGNGRMAFAAIGILVVTVAVLQLLRQRTRHRADKLPSVTAE